MTKALGDVIWGGGADSMRVPRARRQVRRRSQVLLVGAGTMFKERHAFAEVLRSAGNDVSACATSALFIDDLARIVPEADLDEMVSKVDLLILMFDDSSEIGPAQENVEVRIGKAASKARCVFGATCGTEAAAKKIAAKEGLHSLSFIVAPKDLHAHLLGRCNLLDSKGWSDMESAKATFAVIKPYMDIAV